MRKQIILSMLVCCAIGSSAQEYWDGSRPDHRFTVGVRGGVNFSKQNNNGDGTDMDYRVGFKLGVEADLNVVR